LKKVRLASLYSGGKDSNFSIFRAQRIGHEISCLVTIHPKADDSLFFHYPNSWVTRYLAEAMHKPYYGFKVDSVSKDAEVEALDKAISHVKSIYDIQGIVHGGITSRFQNDLFQKICSKHKLAMIVPLWHIPPSIYMHELIDNKFQVKVVGVSALGLDRTLLGMSLDNDLLDKLEYLSKKYSFNLSFEGGEAETLVTDCPMFSKKLDIKSANILWDGQRGIFEILEVALVPK